MIHKLLRIFPNHGGAVRRSAGRMVTVIAAAVIGLGTFSAVTVAPAQAGHYGSGCGFGPGSLAGAALGGFAGSHIGRGSGRLAATALGVFLGSAIGGSYSCASASPSPYYAPQHSGSGHYHAPVVSHSHRDHFQNDYDDYYYRQPTQRIRPVRIVAPTRTIVSAPLVESNDEFCREYTAEATIGDEVQQIVGLACMQPDGTWRVVSQEFR